MVRIGRLRVKDTMNSHSPRHQVSNQDFDPSIQTIRRRLRCVTREFAEELMSEHVMDIRHKRDVASMVVLRLARSVIRKLGDRNKFAIYPDTNTPTLNSTW